MTKKELNQSLKDLGVHIERHEILANEGRRGDNVLSVNFIDGWGKIFYTRQQVAEWVKAHQAERKDDDNRN